MPVKQLCLIRHAKSSWTESSLSDFERPLNMRGEKDAPLMGRRLAALGILPDLLLSSPAVRAIRSAEIIASEISYPLNKIILEPRIYEAKEDTLLEILRGIGDSFPCVMIVGHNPGLSRLSQELLGTQDCEMPTCAALCAEFQIASWRDIGRNTGKMLFFEFPKNQ
ncbi:MAG: hypothetical protein A2X49_16190 [Lentisphaerae bacterium GWF2_52_8]|nr:MAG: hypothetical protein A2X49_16190 [Lentisphaerae bacterium GWF2_52_8]